ncbi:MAG: aminoacetone oxidase family FAD-binding enzyme [Lachnospiraceae bacterium]|nr:aminoacetone oxidase family FAD-binding enzyme [Lachnospiraceae bacterium]
MRIAIIGAGAAGMMAGISAAAGGATVFLFEHNDRVGKKLLLTGNGKCNFTNVDVRAEYYNSSSDDNGVIPSVLSSFGNEDTIRFFGELGIYTKNRNGCLYPYSETASSVLDTLRCELKRLGVRELTDCGKIKVSVSPEGFVVTGTKLDNRECIFDRVILATGSKAQERTGSDGSGYRIASGFGHKSVKVLPALTQLKSNEKWLKGVAGVRADARVSLITDGEETASSRGELQLVDSAVSGICVFDISGRASRAFDEGKKVSVMLDFMPDFPVGALVQFMTNRKNTRPEKTLEEYLTGVFNKKLNFLFLKMVGLKPDKKVSQLKEDEIKRLCELIKGVRVNITESAGFDRAQVCTGGIRLDEVNADLSSRKIKGLYFAGEILDVDGRCGGYNLQWAWSSGRVAALSAIGEKYDKDHTA